MNTTPHSTVDEALRLSGGVGPDERAQIVETFGALDSRLRSYPAGTVELQLTIKERGTPSQRTTLEAWLSGQPRLVATSHHTDCDRALAEVRDDLTRQLTDTKNRTEPRNNRQLRRKNQ